jgi:hydroxymethylpyrimidine/phosphomethylpyrimidine kinase
VITLITVQNTKRVDRVECLPADLVIEQIRAVVDDIPPQAAKIGALGNLDVLSAVAKVAPEFPFPLVVDPVMISKHGARLMDKEATQAFVDELLPHATLITPNLFEAAILTGMEITDTAGMRRAAEHLCGLGARAVLVKGGHLEGAATDVLLAGGEFYEFPGPRIDTVHTHGTGCTYSAAITACVAAGCSIPEAVRRSKQFISEAIRTNPGLGRGNGPVNHHVTAGIPKADAES